jgi:hypothetical protein
MKTKPEPAHTLSNKQHWEIPFLKETNLKKV